MKEALNYQRARAKGFLFARAESAEVAGDSNGALGQRWPNPLGVCRKPKPDGLLHSRFEEG
jgi:hypothetical protein